MCGTEGEIIAKEDSLETDRDRIREVGEKVAGGQDPTAPSNRQVFSSKEPTPTVWERCSERISTLKLRLSV